MNIYMIILLSWGIIIAFIYTLIWCDTLYYRYNLPKVCKKILNAFTEEE